MRELAIKSAIWIGFLYLGALVFPKPIFVFYFLCMVFLPLWFADERDSMEEKAERWRE